MQIDHSTFHRPFSRIGRNLAVSLQPESANEPTLDQLPEFTEVGRLVRHQQHRYGRPGLADTQISASGLSELLTGASAKMASRAQEVETKAEAFESRVDRIKQSRKVMGILSVGALGLVPLGGHWTALGLGVGVALGLTALGVHQNLKPAVAEARAYRHSAEEQFHDAERLDELSQELNATRIDWLVQHQTQAVEDPQDLPEVEIDALEDAIVVGGHTLPVQSW